MWVRRSEFNKLVKKVSSLQHQITNIKGSIVTLEQTTTISTPTGETEISPDAGYCYPIVRNKIKHESVAIVLCRLLDYLGIKQKYEKGTAPTVKMCAEGYEEATKEGE